VVTTRLREAALRLLERIAPARLGTQYRRLLAATWTTSLGDGVSLASGPLLVASLTSNAFVVSLAALLRWAPQLVFGLTAGVVSDRLDRRRVVMTADGSRAAVLVVLVAVLVTGHATVVVVLVALGLLATAEVFSDNTSQTLLPMLVRRDDLALANSRFMTGFVTLNQLAGPPIGAALFAAGRALPFVTEAVLVGAGVLIISRIVLPPHRRERRTGGVRRDVVEGIRWTLHHPAIRTLALTILVFNVTFGAAWSVLVLYSRERLGLGALGFGLLMTISALGGLLGTASYGWLTRQLSLGDIMRIGLVIETLTHLALALTTWVWLAALVLFVFGAHAFVWSTTSTTVRQRAVPTELQGRVSGVYVLAIFGGLVVGSLLGGVLAGTFGVTAPFWFAFVGSAAFLVLLWRQLTRIAHDDEQPSLALE
jgi:predicted MFS family arabinose efflux permease